METWQIVHTWRSPDAADLFGTPSVYELAQRHAERHRWLESQKQSRDVGPESLRDWTRTHWRRFCRWRYLEHLLGYCRYREFDPCCFATVCQHQEWRLDPVMEFTLHEMLRQDREQLDVLFHAPHDFNRQRLLSVLQLLNLNAARLRTPDFHHG